MKAAPGAFVISLDFELYWGVRDFLQSNTSYLENLYGEREAVGSILELFEEFSVSATWATVGLLFARSASEARSLRPSSPPTYLNPLLSPFNDDFADSGREPALLFAPDLVDQISDTLGQEVATHTFSHFYALEDGQNADQFDADIQSAVEVAGNRGIELRSIVFPRNQHNPEYDPILKRHGIVCYRGNQRSRMYQFDGPTLNNPYFRATRLADTYFNVSGHNTFGWSTVWENGLANIPASIFLRPVQTTGSLMTNLQFGRIARAMEHAATTSSLFHLWWHPHNFGLHLDENLIMLRRILDHFRQLNLKYGFESLSMISAAERANEYSDLAFR